MSIASWKAEFYPMDVESVPFDAVQATRHSLVKWTGLREANRVRHSVELRNHSILVDTDGSPADDDIMQIDSSSCALCQHFYDDHSNDDDADWCARCPLNITLGMSCDDSDGRVPSPWDMWTNTQDPEPMIAALEQTLNRLNDQG